MRRVTVSDLRRMLSNIPVEFDAVPVVDARSQYMDLYEDREWMLPQASMSMGAIKLDIL